MAFYQINDVNMHYTIWNEQATETCVAFHGFTGSTNTWQHVAKALPELRIIAVDLIGHGQTDSPLQIAQYTMDAHVDLLHTLLVHLVNEPFHLLGYSMGGRVALSYAIKYPTNVKHLLLESASPGLAEEAARKERKSNDEKLAERILHDGLEAFIQFWANIPLFASQKKLPLSTQLEVQQERLAQNPIGLVNSLRGMGTGDMPSVWHKLSSIQLPVTLITGGLDQKFVTIAEKMCEINKNFVHVTIPNYGHAIHVENPQKFATIVKESIFNY
jgi:2-succinyl-6-hydroxy-2,4-cyclohexadiene-1-carboxylate synthase